MVGRTNALLQPLVSSVNGISGVVVLTPGDIGYDSSAAYPAGSLGEAVVEANTAITTAQIDSMYTVPDVVTTLNTPGRAAVLNANLNPESGEGENTRLLSVEENTEEPEEEPEETHEENQEQPEGENDGEGESK